MQEWAEIRRRVLNGEASKRQILRETGMHWTTLEKILSHSAPPGYRLGAPREKPKLDGHLDWIREVLQADKAMPKKQRHTAKRIWDRLRQERGFTGGYTIVKDAVREIKRTSREVFMPLTQPPGEAQVDFFEALAKVDGTLRKVHVFVMSLPYSDMFFVMAFPRECTEAFWEGHVRAFEFFGGVPKRIIYDNSRIAVRLITGCHSRELTDGFLQLASHYLFDYHFCTVRRANEKGVVEGMAKYARCNFFVPVPQVPCLEGLNEHLWELCWNEQFRKIRGHGATKGERKREEDLNSLPEAPFDAARKQAARANSLSLVRFDDNDYSVPVAHAHHELIVKGYVDHVVVHARGGEEVARHRRLWTREEISYEPVHYLPLLERKPGALDFAAPLYRFELPACFETLRRKLEARDGHAGTKEYIRVLRLIESFSVPRVADAITKALDLSRPTAQIVRMYAQPEESPEAATFRLDGREHLRGVTVGTPDLSAYASLLVKEGVA